MGMSGAVAGLRENAANKGDRTAVWIVVLPRGPSLPVVHVNIAWSPGSIHQVIYVLTACVHTQVNPAWQKSGLGRGVVERLTASLVGDGITTITLFAEPGVVGLYEKLGFVREPSGVRGMAFQRTSSAGGALMLAR